MKKYLTLTIFLLISAFSLIAQKSKDVLYLKNGSLIKGTLIEIVTEQYKIKTSDGSIFIFPASDVEKLTKEMMLYTGRPETGFTFALEAGILLGEQDAEYEAPFSFNMLAGYIIDKKNIISAGSGVEFFGKPFTPLFLEYKRLLSDRKTTPFIYMRGGALMHLGGSDSETYDIYNQYEPYNYKGGLSFGMGTGISWDREDYETYLSFGYRYAHTSYEQKEYYQTPATYNNIMNRLEIKFGFRF
ncbi:MAG TPA: hypothetical protein VMV47_11630 [Bacteroidales bacterium]|nr:hypothetical protein [Bacteroidales bacterium]